MSQTTTVAPAARRGRPRPQITIERDRKVAELMANEPLDRTWTKHDVVEATGFEPVVADHCLHRLSWSGVVTKDGRGTYRRTDKPYTEVYDESLMPDRVKSRRASASAPAEG